MTMKHCLNKAGVVFAIVLVAASSSTLMFACEGPIYKKLVRTKAWDFPDVTRMKKVKRAHQAANQTYFIPRKRTLLELIIVSPFDGNTESLSYNSSFWRVALVSEFVRDGKPYAFIFHLVPPSGTSVPGCPVSVGFYDEDGDGKFETYVPFAPDNPPIPKWAGHP